MKGAIVIEGHVQGLSNTRSLGECGIPVYIVDKNKCIAKYSKYCKKFFISPDYVSDDFADFLVDLAIQENLNGWMLLPSNDHAVLSIAKNKTKLEPHYKLFSSCFDIIQKIYDKKSFLEIASAAGIEMPKTFYFNDDNISDLNVNFPVITKGRFGLSFYKAIGAKVIISENIENLKNNLSKISKKLKISNTFTQEVIPYVGTNNTISYTAFCIDGIVKTYWIGKKLREHPLRFGTATFCESVLCPDLINPSEKLIMILKYNGICEIEYIKDPRDDKYKIIEMNARTWLWVGLAKECGINYALLTYKYLNKESIHFPEGYKANVKWINFLTDFTYSIISITKASLNVTQYIKSMKGSKVKALWNINDPFPYFAYIFQFYNIIRKR